jgi:hypothetical protein
VKRFERWLVAIGAEKMPLRSLARLIDAGKDHLGLTGSLPDRGTEGKDSELSSE